MPLSDLLAPNAVFPSLKVTNKKQAIQELSAQAASLTGQDEREIFETLLRPRGAGPDRRRARRRDPACPLAGAAGRGPLRASRKSRSTSRRSTASRSISSSCCLRPRLRAPTI